jgi:CBS domain-containing protein
VKTSDIMTLGAATVRHDAPLSKAMETMVNHRISALPVVDDKELLCGILTESDVVRAISSLPPNLIEMADEDRKKALNLNSVSKFMTTEVITIGPDAPIDQAVALMKDRSLKRLPVVSNGNILGLLSRADILRALVA